MKCSENDNLPYSGEDLSVNSEQCDVAGIVAVGKNIARIRLFKGGMVEPYMLSWCPFVE